MAQAIHTSYMVDDFLAGIIDERTRSNPAFPRLVAEAEARRKLARRLAALREKRSLSQTVVAARMGTSGRARVAERWTWERIAERTEAAYTSAMTFPTLTI